jgi:hypothetical protein
MCYNGFGRNIDEQKGRAKKETCKYAANQNKIVENYRYAR